MILATASEKQQREKKQQYDCQGVSISFGICPLIHPHFLFCLSQDPIVIVLIGYRNKKAFCEKDRMPVSALYLCIRFLLDHKIDEIFVTYWQVFRL
jgi:hypothetical protein